MTPMPSGNSLIMSTSGESVSLGLMRPTIPRRVEAFAGLAKTASGSAAAAPKPLPPLAGRSGV